MWPGSAFLSLLPAAVLTWITILKLRRSLAALKHLRCPNQLCIHMSALILSVIIFLLTVGGIFIGTLLRRTLPEHHLNEHARDVVRLGVGLIATIAALVLGLLIAAAKGSFDTQISQVRQITADLILLDNILAQYGPEARPIREQIRSTVDPFADRALAREGNRQHGSHRNERRGGTGLFENS